MTGLTVNDNVNLSRIAGDNDIRIQPTTPSSGAGHDLYIEAGQEGDGSGGGDLYLYSGQGSSGNGGNVYIDAASGDDYGQIYIGTNSSKTERIRLGDASTPFTISNQSGFRSAIGLGSAATTASSDYAPAAGSSNITTVGTISTGTWQGTAIAATYVGNLPTSKITSGTFDNARISSASVTQYKATMFSNPTFTGNVDLSRIAGNNEIKIEPDTNTSHNLILKAASQTGNVDGGTPPSGGDITIQAGKSANQDLDYDTTTVGGSVLIKGGEGGDSGGGDGDIGAVGGNVTIEGGPGGGGNAGGAYGQINIGVNNTNQVNIGSISNVVSVINSKAPKANPIFTGHVLPSVDVTQDLGSSSKRWRDLYVSGGTIHLGNVKVKEESGSFKIKDASDNAVPIGDATFAGTTTLGGNISLTSSETEFKPTSVSGEDSEGKTLKLEAGDASGEGSSGGDLILNAGDRTSGSGSGTDGNVEIGLNHTNAVKITPNTTISGTLTVTGAATLSSGFGGTISSATITTLTSTTVNSDTIRGDDFTNSTTGGSVLIRGGNTTSNDGHDGGNINIQGGQATDSQGGDDGNINIGTSNTKAVNIGASGKTTTINGTLSTPNDPLVKNDFGIASIRKVTSGEYNSITPKDENTFYVEVDGIAIFVDCEVGSGANPARNFTAILRDDDNVNTPNPNTLYPAVSIPHAGTGSTDSDDSPRTALGSGTWIGNVFASDLQNDSPLRRITVRLAPQSGSGDSTTHSTITVEKGGTLISNTNSTVSGDTVTDVVIELSGTEDVLLSYGTE